VTAILAGEGVETLSWDDTGMLVVAVVGRGEKRFATTARMRLGLGVGVRHSLLERLPCIPFLWSFAMSIIESGILLSWSSARMIRFGPLPATPPTFH
jgi:hypothetical protein